MTDQIARSKKKNIGGPRPGSGRPRSPDPHRYLLGLRDEFEEAQRYMTWVSQLYSEALRIEVDEGDATVTSCSRVLKRRHQGLKQRIEGARERHAVAGGTLAGKADAE